MTGSIEWDPTVVPAVRQQIGVYGLYDADTGALLYVGGTVDGDKGFNKRVVIHRGMLLGKRSRKDNEDLKRCFDCGARVVARAIEHWPPSEDKAADARRKLDREHHWITKLRPACNVAGAEAGHAASEPEARDRGSAKMRTIRAERGEEWSRSK